MDKLRNKNVIVLIISAILILIAIIVAIVATASSDKNKKDNKNTTEQTVSVDLDAIAGMNNSSADNSQTYSYSTGKYKVATKDDPLGLRLEPNTNSDRIIYIPKGHEVEVIAVWEDWGYVVYGSTGGWLSMNYLELVTGNNSKAQ